MKERFYQVHIFKPAKEQVIIFIHGFSCIYRCGGATIPVGVERKYPGKILVPASPG